MIPHHEGEDPALHQELEINLHAAAVGILSQPRIVGWMLRGTVPAAGNCAPTDLSLYIRSLEVYRPKEVGSATMETCERLFDASFWVDLPNEKPFLLLLNVDDADDDHPDSLMRRAMDEAEQVLVAQERDGGPIHKMYLLRMVINPPPTVEKRSIFRSTDGLTEQAREEAPYEVCIYNFGDPGDLVH